MVGAPDLCQNQYRPELRGWSFGLMGRQTQKIEPGSAGAPRCLNQNSYPPLLRGRNLRH